MSSLHCHTSRTSFRHSLKSAVITSSLLIFCPFSSVQAHGAKADSQPSSRLELDDSTFWDGGDIEAAQVVHSAACNTATCPTYTLDLVAGARRLRVGIDTPSRADTFAIELIDPSGAMVASATNSNQFNSEAMALDPVAGQWTVRIRPENISDTSFRLRAKLESVLPEDLPKAAGRMPLLPNLRTVPPYEFTFIAPANPLNGVYPPDTVNPPLAVGDIHPISCTADESAPVTAGGAGSVHCLRFTSGPMNLGPGIYDMRFSLIDDFIAGTAALNPAEALSRVVVGPMLQVIHYSDGSSEQIPAGTYSFHPVHAHFHDDYVLSFELYAVTNPSSGEMTRVGEGTKSGFCPADQLFADWTRFDQGYEVPGGDAPLGNCFSPQNGVLGLSIGWGDVYRWQRPGMYVEFNGLGDGRYVVQSMVDKNNHVMETNDSDNLSYAYVEIKGDAITLLERGWGTSPWDKGKTVFDGAGPAQRGMKIAEGGSSASGAGSERAGGGLPVATLLVLALAAFRRQRSNRS